METSKNIKLLKDFSASDCASKKTLKDIFNLVSEFFLERSNYFI